MKNKNLINASLGYIIGNILIKGISFLSLPIFARILTTVDIGIVDTFSACGSLLSIIIGLGMASSIRNAKLDYETRLNDYVSTVLIIVSFVELLLLIVAIISMNINIDIIKYNYWYLLYGSLYGFGLAVIQIVNVRLSVDYNYKTYLTIAFINSLGSILVSIILINTLFISNMSFGRILGNIIPLLTISVIYSIRYIASSRKKFDINMGRYALVFGLPLIWHYLSQEIVSQSDRIMISGYKGYYYSGLYSFIYSIAFIYSVIFYSMDNVWSMWSIEQMNEKKYLELRNVSVFYSKVVCVIGIMMCLLSKEIVLIIGGKKYLEGMHIFYPLVLGLFFLFLYTIPVCVEYFFKCTKYIAIITVVSAISNILLNIIFIPLFDYSFAAYSTLISYFVLFLGHWFISKRLMRENNVNYIFRFSDYILCIISLLVVCVVSYYLEKCLLFRLVMLLIVFFYFLFFIPFNDKCIISYIISRLSKEDINNL